jgi:phosphonate transport system substrate-binding protein
MHLSFASFQAPALYNTYEAIATYVGKRLGCATTLHVGQTLDEFAEGTTDAAVLCGLIYVKMAQQLDCPVELVAAPVVDEPRYQGRPVYFSDVIVRRDSPYHTFAALRGCTWAYNERPSHSGYNVVRYSLLMRGTDLSYFGEVRETGFHQRSLQAVLDGEADATAIDSHVLSVCMARQPKLRESLRIIDTFGPSSMPPLVVVKHLPGSLKQQLQAAVCTMHQSERGAAELRAGHIARFVPVTDADYDDIRAMYARVQEADEA